MKIIKTDDDVSLEPGDILIDENGNVLRSRVDRIPKITVMEPQNDPPKQR